MVVGVGEVGDDGGGGVDTRLASNDIGSVLCLAGAMENSYLVWLGRSKLKVGKETVRTLLVACWPQSVCWMCLAHERMLTGRPGT